MTFKKGQSGNPSGKPKTLLPDGRSLSDLCKVHTAKAVDALIEVIDSDDTPPAARVAAVNAILDRGWGKAAQPVEHSGEMKHTHRIDPANLTDEQRRAIASIRLEGE